MYVSANEIGAKLTNDPWPLQMDHGDGRLKTDEAPG